MKKLFILTLALLLALNLLTVPVLAEGSNEGDTIGFLSFLNMSEEKILLDVEASAPALEYLDKHGIFETVGPKSPLQNIIFYDSLDTMLMGLQSGEVSALDIPDCTAKYLCAVNDEVKQIILYHPEKAEGFSQNLLDRLSNGYSFMMLEENSALRDQFDQVIAEMAADGTLEALTRIHIADVAKNGEPEVIAFEKYDGEPIRVAVTGALPPMDYMAEDGSFAGFNTAILAEIGKRLGKNIELVQVSSIGRALALAEGSVDVVFWTRAWSEGTVKTGLKSMNEEEFEAFKQELETEQTEEETAIMKSLHGALSRTEYEQRDMPEGTVITVPYYTDCNVLVVLK